MDLSKIQLVKHKMGSEKGIDVSPVRSDSDHISEFRNENNNITQTKRGLSGRHVQLMAIGGSIGTGLWVRAIVFHVFQEELNLM